MSMNPSNDDPQNVENDGPQRGENPDAGGGHSCHAAGPRFGGFGPGLMSLAKSPDESRAKAALTLRPKVKAGTLCAGSGRFYKG
jgi:hypothetical protein